MAEPMPTLRQERILRKEKSNKMAIYSKRSLKALTGLNPKLVHIMMEAIRETPVDYTVTDGLRTTAQQKALYAQGRTKEGKIVTNADGVYNKSKHQSGNAVDIYPYINGKIDINDKENKLPIIAKHIKKTAERLGYKLRWGGSWTSITDIPHFEIQE